MDAYTQAIERCNKKILEINEIHKDQPEETKAYYTKKVIDGWFARGGLV